MEFEIEDRPSSGERPGHLQNEHPSPRMTGAHWMRRLRPELLDRAILIPDQEALS
ncbi:hypothetical protein ACWPMX_06580 [Tsuneonella sp. HG094]